MSDQPELASERIASALDAIAKEFGSTIDDLSQDPHLRQFLARQLVLRGISWQGQPLPVPPEPPSFVGFVSVAVTPTGDLLGLDPDGRLWLGTSRPGATTVVPSVDPETLRWQPLSAPAAPDPMDERRMVDPHGPAPAAGVLVRTLDGRLWVVGEGPGGALAGFPEGGS